MAFRLSELERWSEAYTVHGLQHIIYITGMNQLLKKKKKKVKKRQGIVLMHQWLWMPSIRALHIKFIPVLCWWWVQWPYHESENNKAVLFLFLSLSLYFLFLCLSLTLSLLGFYYDTLVILQSSILSSKYFFLCTCVYGMALSFCIRLCDVIIRSHI